MRQQKPKNLLLIIPKLSEHELLHLHIALNVNREEPLQRAHLCFLSRSLVLKKLRYQIRYSKTTMIDGLGTRMALIWGLGGRLNNWEKSKADAYYRHYDITPIHKRKLKGET